MDESPGEQVVVAGRIGDRTVGATWIDGIVVGDAMLIVAAKIVVASGLTVDDGHTTYKASLRNLDGAALALMRALDDIESVRITAPAEVPSATPLGGN